MSEDYKKPIASADADVQRTKPTPDKPFAHTIGGSGCATDAIEEDVAGVQGAFSENDEEADATNNSPPIDAHAKRPDVGGGEIEWSELGREPPIHRTADEDEA